MRVGSLAYARANGSFGLTTLRNRHVTVSGDALRFRFRGKSGRLHEVGVRDRRLARIVARCEALPGQDLFEYLDEDGDPRTIESADVNGYLQHAAGIPITAKDFRTWIGTLIAFQALRSQPGPQAAAGRPRATVVRAAEAVAEILGNTPAVSRESYIAPVVVEAYLAGTLPRGRSRRVEPGEQATRPVGRREELALVHFLERGSPASAARWIPTRPAPGGPRPDPPFSPMPTPPIPNGSSARSHSPRPCRPPSGSTSPRTMRCRLSNPMSEVFHPG
jgi:DNA topoisomerase-1